MDAQFIVAPFSQHYSKLELTNFWSEMPLFNIIAYFVLLQIRDKLSAIEAQHSELLETWERRQEEFDHNLDVQMFHRDAEQAESWIIMREAMLGNEEEDVGVINYYATYLGCICILQPFTPK